MSIKKLQLGIYKHKQRNIFYDHPIESYIISLSDEIAIYTSPFYKTFDYYLMDDRTFEFDSDYERIKNSITGEENERCFCNE